MAENDIQQTARFAREFLVMSLIPWMEKCVVEWNEQVLHSWRGSGEGLMFCTVLINP
jgi:hypothetical protein